MKQTNHRARHVLITGSTGFIGREVLAGLLQAGCRVTALVRADDDLSAGKRLMSALGKCCHPQFLNVGNLKSIRGELNLLNLGMDCQRYAKLAQSVTEIVHLAASTQFETDASGEPHRSNVQGLQQLIAFAERAQAAIHHFSTVFVCGDFVGQWSENGRAPGQHRNAYERSKWQGECLLNGALADGRIPALTIYRPSITVVDGPGGSMPEFHGIRLLAMGLTALRRILQRSESQGALGELVNLSYLRICASADDRVHLVPVGWVAERFLEIYQRPELHGEIYHLALPDPPTVGEFRNALEKHLGVQLGPYTDENLWDSESNRHALEVRFYRSLQALRHYFRQKCRFATGNLDRVNNRPASTDFSSLWQYILDVKPKVLKDVVPVEPSVSKSVARFFAEWLPEKAPDSKLAGMPSLNLSVGFSIKDAGDWTCCFVAGFLQSITEGCDLQNLRCGYRLDAALFDKVVAGTYSAQEGFFNNEIEIFGEVEAGLKFAMILQEFVQEFPWKSDMSECRKEVAHG